MSLLHTRSVRDVAVGRELVPLCELILAAERLSLRCTGLQARLARGRPFERLLLAQQRHERGHVALFRSVLAFAESSRESVAKPLLALEAYERLLVGALARGELADSLMGLQLVLEGVGSRLFRGFTAPLALERIKRALLSQEEAHHALGARLLESLPDVDADALRVTAGVYVEAARALLEVSQPLLRRAGIDAEDPRHDLPEWLRS